MPTIQKINSSTQKPLLRADNTGYAALGGFVLTGATAVVKNKSIRKLHKPLAYIAAILSFLHLGVILYTRSEWKKKTSMLIKLDRIEVKESKNVFRNCKQM